jgi:hypothetical protein
LTPDLPFSHQKGFTVAENAADKDSAVKGTSADTSPSGLAVKTPSIKQDNTVSPGDTDPQVTEDKGDGQARETPNGLTVVRTVGRDFRVEGNDVDGYIGVSPEYRTYANPTDKPYLTQGDVDLLVRSGLPTDVEAMTLANAQGQPIKDDEDESDDADKKSDKE